ncbi:hypothetical protein C5Y96_19870 [Blastopirellula marina]|uniref:Flagellar M-ring N-terminal domain-containing protein n=1 Tax=Blastopirellula marina TaxID=124 RepID=A0A2S8F3M8_9BACT|nr:MULTISPECIES: hypothetical protein [Pirellulaceae]PQO26743.1 hypothetical protein C5Y96_19870 [Blastopirellula marina]RCS46222.1 hypothetical protein DTL36_19900 [Bremerella cremea]
MDFLNKAFEQVKDLFVSMTPGSRIIAGLLVVAIVTSVAFLFQSNMFQKDVPILSGAPIAPADQKAILAAFASETLDDYEVVGSQIYVPRSRRVDYIAALVKNNAIPPDFHDSMSEAIGQASPFESEAHRADRQKVAREKEMALVLRNMRGIDYASVQYDIEDKGGFPRKKVYTASVVVRPSGSEEIDPKTVKSVQNYVAHSIAGLDAEHVSVTDLNTRKTFSGADNDLASVNDDPYAARKKWFEDHWTETIDNALRFISGNNVTVNVELDPEMNRIEKGIKYDPRPTPLASTAEKSSEVRRTPTNAGEPGLGAQGPNRPTAVSAAPMTEQTSESNREETLAVTNQDYTQKQLASLTPKRVTVSVSIPSQYYVDVWNSRNPTPAGQQPKTPDPGELKKIEDETKKTVETTVVTLLPEQAKGDDPYPQVYVWTAPQLPETPTVEPAVADTAMAWLATNWQTLATIGFAAVGLLMLRGMLTSGAGVPAQSEAFKLEDPAAAQAKDEKKEEQPEGSMQGLLKKRFAQGSGPNLKNELADMVREDPDTALGILQTWIGSPN